MRDFESCQGRPSGQECRGKSRRAGRERQARPGREQGDSVPGPQHTSTTEASMKGCRPSTPFRFGTGRPGRLPVRAGVARTQTGARWSRRPARRRRRHAYRPLRLSVLDGFIHPLSTSGTIRSSSGGRITDLPGRPGDAVDRARSSCGRADVTDPPAGGSMPPAGWPDWDACRLSRRYPFLAAGASPFLSPTNLLPVRPKVGFDRGPP